MSEPWLNEYQNFSIQAPEQIAQQQWQQQYQGFRTPQEAALEQWQQQYQEIGQDQNQLRRVNNLKILSRMSMNALYQFASHLMIPDKYSREQLIDILADQPTDFRFVNSTIGRDFIGVEFTGPSGLTVVNFTPSDIEGAQLSSENAEAYQQQWEEEYTHRESNRRRLLGMNLDQLRIVASIFHPRWGTFQ